MEAFLVLNLLLLTFFIDLGMVFVQFLGNFDIILRLCYLREKHLN